MGRKNAAVPAPADRHYPTLSRLDQFRHRFLIAIISGDLEDTARDKHEKCIEDLQLKGRICAPANRESVAGCAWNGWPNGRGIRRQGLVMSNCPRMPGINPHHEQDCVIRYRMPRRAHRLHSCHSAKEPCAESLRLVPNGMAAKSTDG